MKEREQQHVVASMAGQALLRSTVHESVILPCSVATSAIATITLSAQCHVCLFHSCVSFVIAAHVVGIGVWIGLNSH